MTSRSTPASVSRARAWLAACCDLSMSPAAAAEGEHGCRRQGLDQQVDGRSRAHRSGSFAPGCLEVCRGALEASRLGRRVAARRREQQQPLVRRAASPCARRLAGVPERGERFDVLRGVGGERQRHRRDGAFDQSVGPQDQVDQRPPGPAVAVGKGMDGLELRVRDRRSSPAREGEIPGRTPSGPRAVRARVARAAARSTPRRGSGRRSSSAGSAPRRRTPDSASAPSTADAPPAGARPASFSPIRTDSVTQVIASTAPSTSSAVTSWWRALSRRASAFSNRRAPTTSPSICDDPTASARSNNRANASLFVSTAAVASSRARSPAASSSAASASVAEVELAPHQRSPGSTTRTTRPAARPG